jgi:hypothetical protein
MADSIKCPSCRAEIPLTEVISHQIEEELAAKLARELAGKEEEFAAKEQAFRDAAQARERELKEQLSAREKAAAEEAEKREAKIRQRFEEAQAAREAELQKRAEERVATALADLGSRVEEKDAQLREAQERELSLLAQKRKLDEEKEKLGLELARRLDEERGKIAAEARKAAGEEHQLEIRQKELQVDQMKRQIKELQESAEQTRAGLIGEAQEREIEDVLREKFRSDRIEPVRAGVRGAEVLQTVYSSRGESAGKILWESKRARNWSNGWITKLKEDQASAGADVAVLVSSVLPADVSHMELVDGVWVVGYPYATCIAEALRAGLIGIAHARVIDANRNDSLHEIYDYLTSNDFNRRVRALVEAFVDMKADLESERRSMERIWAKRAKQLDALAMNTAGMYGELEALIGTALPPIETLELPAPVPLRSAS